MTVAGSSDTNIWRVAPGDPTCVFVPGVAKPINCGSQKAAALIVTAVNAYGNPEPLLIASEAVLAHFAPTFPDSRAWDDCLVGLAVAVSNFKVRAS